jgi:hypothetical protein
MNRLRIAACAWLLWAAGPVARAQGPEAIGRIEGEAFVARGQVSVSQEGGRSVTTLLSGSQVTVSAGAARIVLLDGGEIDICGPAQFSLLKSGGAVTLALSHGRVHARVSAELPLTIYTALVVATPVSIAGKPRDVTLGLDAAGEMCAYSAHGAIRLAHQFSGQSVLVPQYGEVSVSGGQIESLREAAGSCRCDLPVARNETPAATPAPRAAESAQAKSEEKRAEDAPAFTAVMPPLTFDAASPNPLPMRPVAFEIIREARVRTGVRFAGTVAKPAKLAQVAAGSDASGAPALKKPGFGARFANFFRRLFGRKTTT